MLLIKAPVGEEKFEAERKTHGENDRGPVEIIPAETKRVSRRFIMKRGGFKLACPAPGKHDKVVSPAGENLVYFMKCNAAMGGRGLGPLVAGFRKWHLNLLSPAENLVTTHAEK